MYLLETRLLFGMDASSKVSVVTVIAVTFDQMHSNKIRAGHR